MIIIGIDPDIEKNGVARLDTETRKVDVQTLDFPNTLEYIKTQYNAQLNNSQAFVVVIEASWLGHNGESNWHLSIGITKYKAAALGRAVGMNQQTGILLGELCRHCGIPVNNKPPLPKIWQGKDRKITHEEIAAFIPGIKHTNQEGRDAALLAWEYASLPIRIPPKPAATKAKTSSEARPWLIKNSKK